MPPDWLALLAPLPADEGICERKPMAGGALAGWTTVKLELGDGLGGMRIVMATVDPEGRIDGASDIIATDMGQHQETVMAKLYPDGRVGGTHWLTEGETNTPRPMTPAEQAGLVALAEALLRRCPTGG